jgi:alanine dehydrogenase
MPGILLLSRHEVDKLLTMDEALRAVEQAFKLELEGKTVMPPKIYLELPEYGGDFRAMPAYVNGNAGVKWVCVYPNNGRYGLPSVLATIILSDPNNGLPLAVMDGTHITNIRTGAAGGVAIKYLARKDASVVGIIGAGMQARTQLMAASEVFPRIQEVKVFDCRTEATIRYVQEMVTKLKRSIRPVETIEEACQADIVITTTPSTKPLVKKEFIRPGTHINAIGADAPGKQELESELTRKAKIIVDDMEQACHSGEVNVPISEGKLKVQNIYGTMGEVVAGIKKGRVDDDEITIFDSTGIAIHDLICAGIVYKKAKERQSPLFQLL